MKKRLRITYFLSGVFSNSKFVIPAKLVPAKAGSGNPKLFYIQEHKDWLEESGFSDFRRAILDDGSSIITARKNKGDDAA